LESPWRVEPRQADQLTDDEIAKQWEYNVVDPHTPEIIEKSSEEEVK
jgi:GTP-binding protein